MNSVRQHHKGSVTTVIAGGKYHPLVSVWNKETKNPILDALMSEQLSVMKLLQELDVIWMNGSSLTNNEELIFTNINSPIDLKRS
jgi:molybdenum cofactor guanylyltransferase